MTKIVITGGLGHIGSYLLSKLSDAYKVLVMDNMSTNKHHTLFTLDRTIELVEDDITSSKRMSDYFEGVDIVIHLAAIVNAGDTIDKEGLTRETNCLGVKRVVEAAEKAKVPSLIHLSTASVYGPHPECRDEETEILLPQTPYARYKLEGEEYVSYSKIPNYYILRAGTIFGYSSGMRFHTVVNKFVWNAITGGQVTIWKPGTGLRPYLSLDHLETAISFILENKPTSGIYNLATWHWSPKEVVNHIQEFIPEQLNISYVTPRIINQDEYTMDCEKAVAVGLYNTYHAGALTQLEHYVRNMYTRRLPYVNRYTPSS